MRALFLCCILLVILTSCRKHSAFTGKITNSADGLPMENIEVRLYYNRSVKGGGIETIVSQATQTNTQGEYAIEADATTRAESGELTVTAPLGFEEVAYHHVRPGECDEVDFVLNPLDAWLSVTFINGSASSAADYRTSFLSTTLPNSYHCLDGGCGPFNLQPGESKNHIGKVPGGENITATWSFVGVNTLMEKTVFCPRNDTTYVTITL